MKNPVGLQGITFVEFASPTPEKLDALFTAFGFSLTESHGQRPIDAYRQHEITFLLNRESGGFAEKFQRAHGPSLCSMGWKVQDSKYAWNEAVRRGAQPCLKADYDLPAIYGIGDSVIYFVEADIDSTLKKLGFVTSPKARQVPEKGFLSIDHLTNNVARGEMGRWANFYKQIFGFEEVRYFDIRGAKTGLTSYALRSPDGSFCIPINEGTEAKSQINEYLEEYQGAGVQHLAFLTNNILTSLDRLDGSGIETLDIDDDYYNEVFTRVPHVTEDHTKIRKHQVLVDGDDEGYLLQIFTKNLVGPIFIEIIQRKNHLSFGEGNFGALFRSIERDQQKRGYLA